MFSALQDALSLLQQPGSAVLHQRSHRRMERNERGSLPILIPYLFMKFSSSPFKNGRWSNRRTGVTCLPHGWGLGWRWGTAVDEPTKDAKCWRMCCPQENQDALTKPRGKGTARILVSRPGNECGAVPGLEDPVWTETTMTVLSWSSRSSWDRWQRNTHECTVTQTRGDNGHRETRRSATERFNLSTMDIQGRIILCCGGCPVPCGMSSNTLGLDPLDATIQPHPIPQSWQLKISPDTAKCPLGGCPW